MPDGRVARFEVPEGTTPEQAQSMMTAHFSEPQQEVVDPPQQQPSKQPPEPFGSRLNRGLSAIPRQLGLTARYGVEGMADVAGIFTNPLAATANALGGNFSSMRDATSGMLDKIGLPSPNTPTERVVGDASRMLAGGGGMVKGAQMATNAAPWAAALAARPELQAASGVGAGLSGGYVRETGGDPMSQGVAALAGGLLAPVGLAGGMSAVRGVKDVIGSIRSPVPPQVNVYINQAIEQSGYKLKDVPVRVVNTIKADAARAMKTGELSPDALRRLVDYRLIGATPARGNLTLNPIDVTNQKNLSKIGANTNNANMQALALRENENTGVLLGSLNELGANTADDAYRGGQRVISALEAKQGAAKGGIDAAYSQARDSQGRSVPIDHVAFTSRANDLIDQAMVGGQLPSGVRDNLNKIAKGEMPLTVEIAEQFKTQIGNLQRASNDGSTRMALGLVRQALDEAPLVQSARVNPGNLPAMPGTVPPGNLQIGEDAVSAFNTARGLNRNWMGLVEKTPALKAVVDGVDPDKFVSDYIIRSGGKANVMDVARLKNQIKGSPDAIKAVREQILAHLKGKATSGKPDEAMTFSQSGYNNAFSAIGERKLRMFFNRTEINKLKAVGRVAMYEQIQPSGSAVNNSNSGALAVAKAFDWIAKNPIVNKIPFADTAIIRPAQSISQSIQGSGARNIPSALNMPAVKTQGPRNIPWPLLLTPGLVEE